MAEHCDADAATRGIEIVSEASRRLPDNPRARHPDLPWRAIRDAGNYDRYAYDQVLEAVFREIDALDAP